MRAQLCWTCRWPPRPATIHEDGTATIPLTQGKTAIIDAADAPAVTKFAWKATCEGPGLWYAACNVRTEGRRIQVRMHRLLMGATRGEVVDHINNNGLDNRRSNLRIVTASQNAMNRRHKIGASSRFKGVTWNKKSSKWQAGIQVSGKSVHLGLFTSETDAAIAHDAAAIEHFGEFSHLNFPLEDAA